MCINISEEELCDVHSQRRYLFHHRPHSAKSQAHHERVYFTGAVSVAVTIIVSNMSVIIPTIQSMKDGGNDDGHVAHDYCHHHTHSPCEVNPFVVSWGFGRVGVSVLKIPSHTPSSVITRTAYTRDASVVMMDTEKIENKQKHSESFLM